MTSDDDAMTTSIRHSFSPDIDRARIHGLYFPGSAQQNRRPDNIECASAQQLHRTLSLLGTVRTTKAEGLGFVKKVEAEPKAQHAEAEAVKNSPLHHW